MIHLPYKYSTNSPQHLLTSLAIRKIKSATDTFDGDKCNGHYKHDSITDLLRAFSVGKTILEPGDKPKCFYCESSIEKGVTLQVEHYRPKSKVEAIDNNNIVHPGYYWLGLEWTNLLLSCPKCNGKSGKANRFPISGIRALPIEPVDILLTLDRTMCIANQNPLLLEKPVLLNPEIDHPEKFLTFDEQSFMSGYGFEAFRGERTKDILQLNRDPLIDERQSVRNNFINDINLDIAGFQIGDLDERALMFNLKKVCRSIRKRIDADQEFALWGRFINNNFETCIVQFIDLDFQDRLRLAFEQINLE